MMANSLMLNKQCLVPAQPPMNLIRVQSGGNEMGTGGQVGRRCTQIIMITEHYQTLARRVFPPTLTSHLKLTGELSISVLNVSYFFFNTCNYFYNRITDQPAAWDWQPSLLWHWWIYLLEELLRSLTREPTDNSKFRDNRVNSQPALSWLLHSSEVKL